MFLGEILYYHFQEKLVLENLIAPYRYYSNIQNPNVCLITQAWIERGDKIQQNIWLSTKPTIFFQKD